MGLFSTIANVARIAGGVLSSIGSVAGSVNDDVANGELQGPFTTFTMSGVTFIYDRENNRILVLNLDNSKRELLLHYSRTTEEGAYVSTLQPLIWSKFYDATGDIEDYANGQVSITDPSSQVEMITSDSPAIAGQTILYSIAILFAVKLALTKKISFSKTDQGFLLESNQQLIQASIRYTDKDGTTYSASAETRDDISTNGDKNQLLIPFPSGAVTDLPFKNVVITVDVSKDTYMEITSERRQKLENISDDPRLIKFLTT